MGMRTPHVPTAVALLVAAVGCAQTTGTSLNPTQLDSVLGAQSSDRTGIVEDFSLSADLDGDGTAETVRLAWLSGGGSGTYDSLVVSGPEPESFLYAAPLGDRVQIRDATVDGNAIVLDTLEAGPGDAMCCADQKYRRRFALRDGEFREIETLDLGRISTTDLAGDWQLVSMNAGETVPASITITLSFDGNRIAGSSGCNRYMGLAAPGEPPRGIRVAGALAGTMMACPPPIDSIEREYLGKLEEMYQFGFLAGNLVISWADDEQRGLLTYRRTD